MAILGLAIMLIGSGKESDLEMAGYMQSRDQMAEMVATPSSEEAFDSDAAAYTFDALSRGLLV